MFIDVHFGHGAHSPCSGGGCHRAAHVYAVLTGVHRPMSNCAVRESCMAAVALQ
jgi:hypothetical protein